MTRGQWIALAVLCPPALVLAVVLSAIAGPLGALLYGAGLLGVVNTAHFVCDRRPALIRPHRRDHHR